MAYDLHFHLTDPSEQSNGKFFTFGPSGQRVLGVSGVQKLVNRWVKIFMERRGSAAFSRSRGTYFGTLIGSNVDRLADLETVVRLYVDDANSQIKEFDDRSDRLTDDERLRDATVLRFNVIEPDGIELWVEITAISGRRLAALLPITVGS